MACFYRLFDLQFTLRGEEIIRFLVFILVFTCAFRFCFRVFSQILIVKMKEWISSPIHLTIVALIDLFLLLIQITIRDQTVNM